MQHQEEHSLFSGIPCTCCVNHRRGSQRDAAKHLLALEMGLSHAGSRKHVLQDALERPMYFSEQCRWYGDKVMSLLSLHVLFICLRVDLFQYPTC